MTLTIGVHFTTYVIGAILIWIGNCLFCAVREVITSEVIVKTEERQVFETRITIPPFWFET